MKETQLTAYGEVWKRRFPDGEVPWKILAQVCKKLEAGFPKDRIVRELDGYLSKVAPQFINLHKWAATFGNWAPAELAQPAGPAKHFEAYTVGRRLRFREVTEPSP